MIDASHDTGPVPLLASASPQRRELIRMVADGADAIATDIDESFDPTWAPEAIARDLAIRKAIAALAVQPGRVVIGADTIVVVDGEVLNKPEDRDHGRAMLTRLAGRSHEVYTGVAVAGPDAGELRSEVTRSVVTFFPLSDEQIEQYLDTGVWTDKAGAYGIQGVGGDIVARVDGCFQSVVGFPLCSVARLLVSRGVGIRREAPTCGLRVDTPCPYWPTANQARASQSSSGRASTS
ncbi:MAG: Maf family protein [Chloroflexota bacterium]|nr:Maf family protein [Chloroflexota bacterium]